MWGVLKRVYASLDIGVSTLMYKIDLCLLLGTS